MNCAQKEGGMMLLLVRLNMYERTGRKMLLWNNEICLLWKPNNGEEEQMDISTPSAETKAEPPQKKLCRTTFDNNVKSAHAALQANVTSP